MRWASSFEKLEPHRDLLGKPLGQVGEQLVVARLAGAEDHPLHVRRLGPLRDHFGDQVETLLIGEPADHRHQRLTFDDAAGRTPVAAPLCRPACRR